MSICLETILNHKERIQGRFPLIYRRNFPQQRMRESESVRERESERERMRRERESEIKRG